MSGPLSRWQELLRACGAADDRTVRSAFERIAACYAEPHRRYHTLAHVMAVLDAVDLLDDGVPDLRAVRLAAWLHDVVYDVRADDNEARSADAARELLNVLGVPDPMVDECCAGILATADHVAHDAAQEVLLDADLAVLAGTAADYDAYAAAVREEYGWVPDEDFRAGRADVLRGLLAHDRLFRTDAAAAWEPRARANLTRELAALAAP